MVGGPRGRWRCLDGRNWLVLETGRLVVLAQIRLQCKTLMTALAVEIFESRVGLHVSSEVGSVREGFSTVSTTVGFVAGVAAHVALQKPRPRESLPTNIALVVEVVSEDVHAEGRHRDVHLGADVALLGIVGVEGPVGLPVPRQVGGGGVMLPTL